MYGIKYYINVVNSFQKINDNEIDFFLLVFSTILIAAGGNIINDYFDVKADRINKPEKLILTKHIKRVLKVYYRAGFKVRYIGGITTTTLPTPTAITITTEMNQGRTGLGSHTVSIVEQEMDIGRMNARS